MAGLRRVEDRRRHQRAVDAAVGDREGAAGQVGDAELAVARLVAELGDSLLDLGKGARIGVAQHRHHQALRRADGDTDVVVVLVDQLVALDLGIDRGSSLRPAMQALTKNDMKPSRAPCFFSKSSLSRSRSAMTPVMSTSLKVVSMAAVFCASFRRLAMVRRSRVMRTRSSRSARGRGPAGTAGLATGAG
jgi:hypothetical protein